MVAIGVAVGIEFAPMTKKNPAAAALGKLGGQARAKLPVEKLAEIGKKGADARWSRLSPQERRAAMSPAIVASARARRKRAKMAEKKKRKSRR